jgi:hypothetical protein
MSIETIIPIFSGLVLGILLTYLHFKGKVEVLKSKIEHYQNEIENIKDNELTVLTYPFTEENGEDGLLTDSREVEIGYKYQLFIKGVPCLEAHKVVLNKLTKKQIVPSKIDALSKEAIKFIENIASIHPAIKAAQTAPAIAEAIADKLAQKS